MLLEPRSLYWMTGTARYDYEHSILGGEEKPELWRGERQVPRDRRISIIIRDEV
jgi:alkylated DNA repair dioxygenase AlkB